MTFKTNQPVRVEVSRNAFETGKFMGLSRGGKIKILFSDNTYDLFAAAKVKAVMPKREKKAVVEDALTKVERKAGRDPSEHVGAWDTAAVRKAVATFGKRAKMTGRPYHEIRNAYEAKHGAIPKPTASERAQIVREAKSAEAAIMNAAEDNAKSKTHRAIKNVSFTPSPTGTHYLTEINLRTFNWVLSRLRTHLVFLHNGKLRGYKRNDMNGIPTATEIEKCRADVVKRFTTDKDPKPVLIFFNGMTDAALIETVATKVR